METTVLNARIRNPYFWIPRDFNETWLAKVNLGAFPAFRTASDKSWAWRPGNEAIPRLDT